jgi:16S rRNA (uracil1498-N3)-methyltransferase
MRLRAEAAPSYVYAPDLGEAGSRIVLSESETHYLVHVCRARVGDRASATDGRGAVGSLRVTTLQPRVTAEVESVTRATPARRAWVWSGAPEGERADWLVEKLAELGVERWQPLQCERGSWRRGAARVDRWRRLSLAGMRQSRRGVLMEVREPVGLPGGLESVPAEAVRWLASPEGPSRTPDPSPGLSVGAIGPAGGFTPAEERALLGSGFSPISLSRGRLRSETAALGWALWWGLG